MLVNLFGFLHCIVHKPAEIVSLRWEQTRMVLPFVVITVWPFDWRRTMLIISLHCIVHKPVEIASLRWEQTHIVPHFVMITFWPFDRRRTMLIISGAHDEMFISACFPWTAIAIRKARGMLYYHRIVNGVLTVHNRADTVVDYFQRRAEHFT